MIVSFSLKKIKWRCRVALLLHQRFANTHRAEVSRLTSYEDCIPSRTCGILSTNTKTRLADILLLCAVLFFHQINPKQIAIKPGPFNPPCIITPIHEFLVL